MSLISMKKTIECGLGVSLVPCIKGDRLYSYETYEIKNKEVKDE